MTRLVVVLSAIAACAPAGADTSDPAVRWAGPSEVAPHGRAPNARHRVVLDEPGGVKEIVLVLGEGDDVPTALLDLANAEHLRDAHVTAIGGVRDPSFAWFDPHRHQFKVMTMPVQGEVLTLSGDITVGADGKPAVHAHVAIGLADGRAVGGHLVAAAASPTLEVYVSEYPTAMYKRERADGLQLIDPLASAAEVAGR